MVWKLDKVISGGQIGADEVGVTVAKRLGIPTGGTMPFGFLTLNGLRPDFADLYGMTQHTSSAYPPRTRQNVADSDGTIRFAFNFESRGEICTLNAILKADKPYFDVDLSNLKSNRLSKCVAWLMDNEIKVLNVAGNATKETGRLTEVYLTKLFLRLGYEEIK